MTLDIITAPSLAPLRHGFFSRKGGASSGVFSGLNCGRGSSDQTEAVRLNRARAAQALDVAPERLIGMHQIHSARVVEIKRPEDADQDADGMVTNRPGLALAVLTADCQPVLLADHDARVIGAVHAGWRGAAAGILQETVSQMERLGARAERIKAVIGPTIGQPAYEVGADFRDAVLGADPEAKPFFSDAFGAKPHFDLPGYGVACLARAGVHAVWTGDCTYSDQDRFYSFRRTTHRGEADYGRLLSAIVL